MRTADLENRKIQWNEVKDILMAKTLAPVDESEEVVASSGYVARTRLLQKSLLPVGWARHFEHVPLNPTHLEPLNSETEAHRTQDKRRPLLFAWD